MILKQLEQICSLHNDDINGRFMFVFSYFKEGKCVVDLLIDNINEGSIYIWENKYSVSVSHNDIYLLKKLAFLIDEIQNTIKFYKIK